jgi:dTDP-4-amino-4,6-dideoxygalactose transaminase
MLLCWPTELVKEMGDNFSIHLHCICNRSFGARPVFVDIDPLTFNLDPEKIEAAVTPRTRAILPVHLFGLSCDMGAIQSIAEKHGLIVVEDACQSHGAVYKSGRVGSFGTGTFSLYPTKNMTSAEGGMITTNDDQTAEKCRVIRQHGMRRRYYHDELGTSHDCACCNRSE